MAQYAQAQGFTKVGAIIVDYGWGRAIESDFTTYLRSLDEFGPELIVATGHPPGSGGITVQSSDLGFEVPTLATASATIVTMP